MASRRRILLQMQAATDSVVAAPSPPSPVKSVKSPRPRMMRQYDLVERVRSYNHDTNEDTEATRAEIDHVFGHEIGALVEGLTKLKRLELVSREAKQAENLRKLLLAIADDVRVLLIKLADRLHNMRTLEFVAPTARHRIAEETLDIYAPLAGRMGMQEMREELEDLSFHVLDPEAYSVVMQRLDALAERNRNLIGEIESQLSKNLQKNGMTAHVYGRRKRP